MTVPLGAMQIVSALFVENFEMRQAPAMRAELGCGCAEKGEASG